MAKRFDLKNAVVIRQMVATESPAWVQAGEGRAYAVSYLSDAQREGQVKTEVEAALERAMALMQPGDVLRVHFEIEGAR